MCGDNSLTNREMQVAQLVAKEYANKQIALELGISIQTAKNYVSSIIAKLGVKSRVGVALRTRS